MAGTAPTAVAETTGPQSWVAMAVPGAAESGRRPWDLLREGNSATLEWHHRITLSTLCPRTRRTCVATTERHASQSARTSQRRTWKGSSEQRQIASGTTTSHPSPGFPHPNSARQVRPFANPRTTKRCTMPLTREDYQSAYSSLEGQHRQWCDGLDHSGGPCQDPT